jgi:glutamine synthetase type III
MKASLTPLLNLFSNLVFDDEQMRKWLDKKTYQQFRLAINADSKEILDIALANKIAEAMKN